jgi:Tol biopolymer transport system component
VTRLSSALARSSGLLVLASALATLAPATLSAQYFGRNKVQYESFDFRVLRTDHFDIHWYPAESLATADAARMAERWYARLSQALTHAFSKKPIIFYANHPDFQQTNVVGGFIDQSTGGITEGLRTRIVMPFTGVYAENDHVLGHEIVHGFQYDIAMTQTGGLQNLGSLPLWVIEGMAEYFSVGREDSHTAMWLRDAALRNDIPTIKQLTRDRRYFPYRYGQALWAYIGGRYGDEAVTRIYRVSLREGFEAAFHRVLNKSTDSVSKEWHAAIREAYTPVTQGRTTPDQAGARLLKPTGGRRGDTDISPSLSPDGRLVAFFSGRGIFGIDLYIADAQTGQIEKRLTSPNSDNHFDALSFLNSAGSWSPDGKRLAFVTQVEGDHEISVYDMDQKRIVQTFRPPEAEAITDPAWGPDGRIAFVGYGSGISDLFTLDPATGDVQRLTNDRHSELHPAWSPDGRTIAFSTDRDPNTDFDRLTYSRMRIALIDPSTRDVRLVPRIDEGAKHINPQWAPDGQSLFFIADRGGVSDVYRWSTDGSVRQVTRLVTGISGITSSSPALSVARSTGRMMFSVFTNQGNSLFRLEPDQTVGSPLVDADAPMTAGVLPPATASNIVAAYLDAPLPGLPPSGEAFAQERYRPRLQLDYIGAPAVGLATSPFGTGLSGAIALYFGDMLGDRVVGGAVQAQGSFKDIGGEVFYLNQKHRWNWLASGSHIPYLSGFAFADTAIRNGRPFDVIERQLLRAFYDEIGGKVQYPFSQTRRFELGVSGTRVSYDIEIERYFFDFGQQVGLERESGNAPPGVTYVQGVAALVGDYSIFGLTSPVAGGRWRFEVSPIFGGLNFQTFLADWRRYFYARPVTLAFRALHFGRYGRDAESDRISPLFVGYEQLLRGYAAESFEGGECTRVNGSDECPEFDRLIGSRIGIASLELRLPLLGPEGFGVIPFNFLPLEIAPFIDAGVAWTKDDNVRFAFDRNATDRVPVASYGVSARVNLLGYAVLEAYYAFPTHRRRGWHWGFNFAPGW